MSNGRLPHAQQLRPLHRSQRQLLSDDVDYDLMAPNQHDQQNKHLGGDYSLRVGYQPNLNQDPSPNYDENLVDPRVVQLIDALVAHEAWDWIAFRKLVESANANSDDYKYQEYNIAPDVQQNMNGGSPLASEPFSQKGRNSPRLNNHRQSTNNLGTRCAAASNEKWSHNHELVCSHINVTIKPMKTLTHNSRSHHLTDLHGNLVEVMQGNHGGEIYDQKVDVHWCTNEGARCNGVFGNSQCQMEYATHWLYYKELNTGRTNIQLGGIMIPSYCSCMLTPQVL